MGAIRSVLLVLARAHRDRRCVRLTYTDAGGATTERDVQVLGVSFQDGRWYLFAHCSLRDAVRLFRADRVVGARPTRRRARAAPPQGFDAGFFATVEYLEPGAPVAHLVTFRLDPPLAAAASDLFPTALLEREGRSVVGHVRASRPAVLGVLMESLGMGARLLSSSARHDDDCEPRAPPRRVH